MQMLCACKAFDIYAVAFFLHLFMLPDSGILYSAIFACSQCKTSFNLADSLRNAYTGVITALLPMQDSGAKRLLKQAIQAQHEGSGDVAKFTVGFACACVELGLKPRTGQAGYELQPVLMTKIGEALATLKGNSSFATQKLGQIIATLHLDRYFEVRTGAYDKELVMHIAEILPNFDKTIRHLLPAVPWHEPVAQSRHIPHRSSQGGPTCHETTSDHSLNQVSEANEQPATAEPLPATELPTGKQAADDSHPTSQDMVVRLSCNMQSTSNVHNAHGIS